MRLVLPPRGPKLIGSYETHSLPKAIPENWIALDTECTGLDPWGKVGVDRKQEPARPFMVSVCNADGECGFIRWAVDPVTRKVHHVRNDWLAEILANESINKIFFNATFDMRMLEKLGYEIRGEIIDVLLMIQALDPDAYDKRLKPLSAKHCDIPTDDEKALHESCIKVRGQVRRLRSKIKAKKPILANQVWMSRWLITEPKQAEWQDKKPSDDDSARGDMFLADAKLCNEYAMKDAYRTAMLYVVCVLALDQDMGEGGKAWECFRMEQSLQPGIKAMEDRGVRVDRERTLEIAGFYLDLLRTHIAAVEDEAGADFNPDSWKDKQWEFLAKRGYTPIRYTEKKERGKVSYPVCAWCKKTKDPHCDVCKGVARSPKLDAEFLDHIGVDHSGEEPRAKDKLAWHLLHWSAAKTMMSFISAYVNFMCHEDGAWVIHPNYKQAEPVTGRLSAEKPNLQNVASDDSGKKRVDVPYRPRECFIPRKGFIFYAPDYSQIEMWHLALQAQDPKLLEILLSGGDVHGKIAQWSFKDFDLESALASAEKDKDVLTEKEAKNLHAYVKSRKKVKNLQFCKVYGGGIKKIAFMMETTLEQAVIFDEKYNEAFPGVEKFMRSSIADAKRLGYTENAYGVRYPISCDRAYVAANYKIQGSAAYQLKRAMTAMHALSLTPRYLGKMFVLLNIHDELLIEVMLDIDDMQTKRDIAWAMQADHLRLGCPKPFPIGFAIASERWSETKKVKL
jgi:DNA polymerase I-like protein with 3'-5' exonuclease and polymerase domains